MSSSIHSIASTTPLMRQESEPEAGSQVSNAVSEAGADGIGNQPGARLQRWLHTLSVPSRMRAAARAVASGVDLHGGAKTLSYTGFDLRTTAPLPCPAPQLHDNESPRPALQDARLAPQPDADAVCMKPKDEYAQTPHDARHPISLPKDIAALPCVRDAATPLARDVAITSIMQAAMQACGDSKDPAADIARALHCLRGIDLAACIRAPEDCKHAADPADVERAWSIALQLETTPASYAVLQALTAHDPDDERRHPSARRHDDIMLHAYLQAAREKIKEADKNGRILPPDPLSIRQASAAQKTVLDKAIVQIARHLDASHLHALSQPRTAFSYQAAAGEHEWAIGFIRNGLYSDDERADGKPTRYALIEGRLNKTGTWFDRASRSAGDTALESAWNGLRKTMKEFVLPTHGKSPLHAYNRLGEGWWFDRQSGAAIDHAEQGVIHDGRAFKDLILANLIKGLQASGGEHGQPLRPMAGGMRPNPPPAVIHNLARLAVLIETDRRTANPASLLQGEAPDALLMERARTRLYAWLAGGESNQTEPTNEAIRDALEHAGKPLTLGRLREWASVLPGGPADPRLGRTRAVHSATHASATASSDPDALPDWGAFEKGVKQVTSGRGDATPTPHFGKLDGASDRFSVMGQVFESVIARQEPGSKFSLSSGGEIGGGLKEVSRTLAGLMTFTAMRPRVDASATRKCEAFLEIESSMNGRQVFAGTRRSWKFQGGVGAAFGPGAKIRGLVGLKAGPSADVYANREKPVTRGVRLRLAPGADDDLFTDRASGEALGRAFRQHVVERAKGPGAPAGAAPGTDGSSILKNLLQQYPEMIVSWHEYTDEVIRKGGGAKAGATASLGPLTAGLAAGANYESKTTRRLKRTLVPDNAYGQARGFSAKTHGEKQVLSQTDGVNLFRHLTGTAGDDIGPQAGIGARLMRSARKLLRESLVTSQEIGAWGGTQTDTLLLENGAITKQSWRSVTHLTSDSLIARVGPQLDRWAVAKAAREDKDRVATGAGHRQAAYDRAYHMLSAQLEEARQNGGAGQQYTEYHVLTDRAVQEANLLYSAAALARAADDRPKEERCRAALESLLAGDDAWEPHSLWTQQTSADERSRPALKFGVYLGQRDAVVRSNMKVVN